MYFHVDIPMGPAAVLIPMQRIADIPIRVNCPLAFVASEVAPDVDNSVIAYQPGPLISYRGKRLRGVNNPCFHVNLVGDYYIRNNRDEDDVGYVVTHSDIVPERAYEVQFPRWESLIYYDPQQWNGLKRCHSVEPYRQWYEEMITEWTITPYTLRIHYSYRNIFNGRENNADEYVIQSVARRIDGDVLTFTCERRTRGHMTGHGPPDPYPWSDPEIVEYAFTYQKVNYLTYMTTRAQLEMAGQQRVYDNAITACMQADGNAVRMTAIADAVNSVTPLDMNNIENASQIGIDEVLSPMKDFIALARNYRDPVQWVKTTSSLFLFWKYAVKPTVSDVQEALRVSREGYNDMLYKIPSKVTVRGQSSRFDDHRQVNIVSSASVSVIPTARSAVTEAIARLDKLGLAITPSNLWDLVPYSFVVDWFVNTNDILDIFSANFHSYLYTVGEIVASYRCEKLVTNPNGVVRVIVYDRTVTTSFPPLSLQGKDAWRSHIMEGTALIVG